MLKQQTKLRVRLYARLSKDDGDADKESNSITNQLQMLRYNAKEKGFEVIGEYVDDGYSGTTFNRPDLNRMIKDAMDDPEPSGIMVKDIASALGTTTDGTDTNKIATYLNNAFGLGYQVLWYWDNSTLPTLVTNNIGTGAPIILHVSISNANAGRNGINDTSKWPYTTSGHYMNLNGYTDSGRVCNVTDPYADRVSGYSSGKYSVTYTAVNNVCDRAIF